MQAALLNNVTNKVTKLEDCNLLCSTDEVASALQTLHKNLRPKQCVVLNSLLHRGPIWPAQYYDLSAALWAMDIEFSRLVAPTLIWIFQDEDDLIGIAGLLLLFLMWATQTKNTEEIDVPLTNLLGLKDELLKPCKNGLHFIRIATYYGAALHKSPIGV